MSEEAKWTKEHEAWMKTHECMNCGSKHITKTLRGKPYMPYVDFHRKLS